MASLPATTRSSTVELEPVRQRFAEAGNRDRRAGQHDALDLAPASSLA